MTISPAVGGSGATCGAASPLVVGTAVVLSVGGGGSELFSATADVAVSKTEIRSVQVLLLHGEQW